MDADEEGGEREQAEGPARERPQPAATEDQDGDDDSCGEVGQESGPIVATDEKLVLIQVEVDDAGGRDQERRGGAHGRAARGRGVYAWSTGQTGGWDSRTVTAVTFARIGPVRRVGRR